MTLSDIPGYQQKKTSDDYCAGIKVFPNGATWRSNCNKRKLMDASQAQAALSGGRVAFVAPDVYEQLKQGNG